STRTSPGAGRSIAPGCVPDARIRAATSANRSRTPRDLRWRERKKQASEPEMASTLNCRKGVDSAPGSPPNSRLGAVQRLQQTRGESVNRQDKAVQHIGPSGPSGPRRSWLIALPTVGLVLLAVGWSGF